MTAETPAAPAPQSLSRRIIGICAGLGAMAFGVWQLASGFLILPNCTATGTADTIRSIYAGLDQPLSAITEARLVEERDGARICSARIATAAETADITYSVYWEGWEAQVRIDAVDNVVQVQQPAG
jgi:hypothetical protein